MHARQCTLFAAISLGLAGTATAQSGPYDLNGDPITPGPIVLSAVPGTTWNSWNLGGGASSINGVAPYQGDLLIKANGLSDVVQVSEADGSILGTFPVISQGDLWLGYDSSRDLMITANPFEDVLRGYTPGIITPVFEVPTPTPGPTGLAWDSERDEYFYCDFEVDQVVVFDATTLTVTRTLDTPTLTRMAGAAYDCVQDVYIVGDRDQREHFLLDPLTGDVLLDYPSVGMGNSVPRGLAFSSDGGVWSGDHTFPGMFLQEAGHGQVFGCEDPPKQSVCFGDGGDQMGCTDCPCGNNASAGTIGGCLNSAGTTARLIQSGSVLVSLANLRFEAAGLPPSNSAVLTSGSNLAPANMANPCFGLNSGVQSVSLDGLRCVVQDVLRHGVRASDANGNVGDMTNGWGDPDGFFQFSAFTAGDTKHFQIVHRDDVAAVCMTGQNTSQAASVTFQP